jgi:hypothetical protein
MTRESRFYVGLWRATEPIFRALKDENPNTSPSRAVIASPYASTRRTTSSAGADDQLLSGFTCAAGFIGGDEGGRAPAQAL